MATTTGAEQAGSVRLPSGWQHDGDGIGRTFHFDDFASAARFVGRIADAATGAGPRLAIDLRDDRVTVWLAPRDGGPATDDLAVAERIQHLLGDHQPPVGRAGPWSPHGPLTGFRARPVGQAGP
jgi:pterin-4a-carbinolamine dehydratase